MCIRDRIYFRNWLDFLCEFVPQLLFFVSTFVYMTLCIFIKWGTNWKGRTRDAPAIVSQMVKMFSTAGEVEKPLWGDGSGQTNLQQFLFVIAIISVLAMLIPKPIVLFLKHFGNSSGRFHLLDDDGERRNSALAGRDGDKIGEELMHVLIETIEFVLGSLSHTASYLRLWALSLAHGRLSVVLFDMTVRNASNFLSGVLGFLMLCLLTFGILLCMDLLECCLHSLRLHWVEFQSKFYKGDGRPFAPLSFRESLDLYVLGRSEA
eukprot:TRINITY_DN13165_c0_g1_i1.p1 TRINITY_DN13165_c0_g1~~TRINITY_DN13165_c0_g1_i1.p1  ORF type:complete len:263 (+),score=18.13 TRINITY_DN13165_c0_g1_i1:65-853(+)